MSNSSSSVDESATGSLATGHLGELLAQYSIPAIIATAAESIYNIIDRVFIGHGVGPLAISGLAVTLPMMNLAGAFGSMIGVGAATMISIRLGQGNKREANLILGNTLVLNIILSIIYSVFCFIFLNGILFCMGASQETLTYARQFMQIILLGNIFTHVYLGLNNVMRASGYPRKAMVTTLLTVAVNLLLAPLFIFVFHWGIRGAALATVCAQIAGTVWTILHFIKKDRLIRFYSECFTLRLEIIREIIAAGLPSFIILFCATFVAVIENLRLAKYGGDYAIGAFGIINTLANLFYMVGVGVNMGMQPIVGYNYGAGQLKRVMRTFWFAVGASTCITTLGFLLGEFFPQQVANAFTGDAELIRQTVRGMRISFLLFPVIGFQMVTSSFFQSIGHAKISIVLSISRQVLFLIPFLVILPLWGGLDGVWVANPASDCAATGMTAFMLLTQLHKISKSAHAI